MPIRKELRHFYSGPEWAATRARILERAGNCCERCGVPNRVIVLRAFCWWTPATERATVFFYASDRSRAAYNGGDEFIKLPWSVKRGAEPHWACFPLTDNMHWVRIVLTVAHLNHTSGDDRDENLQAMCQWCHLNYDERFHRATRCQRKDAARPILSMLNQLANA